MSVKNKRQRVSQASRTEAGRAERAGSCIRRPGCQGASTWGAGAGEARLSGVWAPRPAPLVTGVARAGSWAGGGALTMTEAGTERWGPSVERGCWLLSCKGPPIPGQMDPPRCQGLPSESATPTQSHGGTVDKRVRVSLPPSVFHLSAYPSFHPQSTIPSISYTLTEILSLVCEITKYAPSSLSVGLPVCPT